MSSYSSRRSLLRLMLGGAFGFPPIAAWAGEFSPWCVAFAPEGDTLAAGSEDGSICLWDLKGGGAPRVWRGHTDAVFGVAFSPDGALLASCGRDAPRVRLWEVATGKVRTAWDAHPKWVWTACFSSDGRRLATCGGDSLVRIYPTGETTPALELAGHEGAVKRLAWCDNGRKLLSAGDDVLLHVWDAATGASLHALAGHTSWLEGVAAAPAGAVAVTAGADRTLRAWDVAEGKELRVFGTRVPDLASVAVDAEGVHAASGAADRSLRIWNIATGAQLFQRTLPATPLEVAFSPDGKRLAAALRDDSVRIYSGLELEEGTIFRP